MILQVYIKIGLKNVISFFEVFSLEFFGDRSIKVTHCEEKKTPFKNICVLDTWQPIKLIIMNHNRYSSSFKVLDLNKNDDEQS
jgi:hypothetical protein